jgi:hypothetical protein
MGDSRRGSEWRFWLLPEELCGIGGGGLLSYLDEEEDEGLGALPFCKVVVSQSGAAGSTGGYVRLNIGETGMATYRFRLCESIGKRVLV